MNVGLVPRITLALALVLGVGLVVTTVLSVYRFESTLSSFLASRYEFQLNDIRQSVETQMDLGLQLTDLTNVLNEEMETHMQADEQVLSIEIFDENGTVLFSTDPSFIGDLVPEEWVLAARTVREREVWTDLQRDARVVGVSLQSNLGSQVGALGLRYSREAFDESVAAQAARLFVLSAIVVLAVIPLGILGAIMLLRRPLRELSDLSEAMDDVANRRRSGENSALGRVRGAHPQFGAFATAAFTAFDTMDETIGEIFLLDEDELP